MKKYIKISTKEKEWIMQAFDVSLVMVNHALGFDKKRGNSDLAKRIRKLALHRGGVLMNELPAFETIHNTAAGEMIQPFENGAKLVMVWTTGNVKVFNKKGELCRDIHINTIEELTNAQCFAASL
ncbi:hypothetical protein [Prevotella pallens]|jgi:hypothetical protein|uniref:hypothetical protein n=1 Tax=Prevotella pallens TaxID=60133 RepID=UPI001CAC7F11|nr:hypothetical protein [Prevotella pallens]MBF1475537.1 hypothetical protein [Prevotella pallens]MBF1517456.1 hypothetical protein [Prevotella pallens]DAR39594.1 MAG TPA: hypothetical protein [Caudoviricetes sp.]